VCFNPTYSPGLDKTSSGIDYANLDYGSSLHFAAVGSDNGHDGTDGSQFLNHPEVINDFAFRAVHVEAVVGKQIVQTYYGAAAAKSYYLGCSTGGRQGTQAALKFPEDFDGIVAGSPATDFNHLSIWQGILSHYVGAPISAGAPSPKFLSPDTWAIVSAEILRQCDALDGVVDGVITEPDGCDFRPESIQCAESTSANCLTATQVETVKNVFTPLFGLQGELVYPRYSPGAEADPTQSQILGGEFFSIAEVRSRVRGREFCVLILAVGLGKVCNFERHRARLLQLRLKSCCLLGFNQPRRNCHFRR
jgi:feruloyl esterase